MKPINLDKNTVYTQSEIIRIIKKPNPNISDVKLKWELFELEKSNLISKIGTKTYITNGNIYYCNLSNQSKNIENFICKNYPNIKYVIWELSQLNEWINFMFAKNIIFLEVEADYVDYIFSALYEKYGQNHMILLNPNMELLSRYIDNCPIVVKTLFSRSPQNIKNHNIAIEKLIVDIFFDKLLKNLIGTNDRFEIV